MKYFSVHVDATVDFNAKFTNFVIGDNYPQKWVAISLRYSMAHIYTVTHNPDNTPIYYGENWFPINTTDEGIQYYDGSRWAFFNEEVQEIYSGYLAEKALLEK